jgi:hypothetical protein
MVNFPKDERLQLNDSAFEDFVKRYRLQLTATFFNQIEVLQPELQHEILAALEAEMDDPSEGNTARYTFDGCDYEMRRISTGHGILSRPMAPEEAERQGLEGPLPWGLICAIIPSADVDAYLGEEGREGEV